LTLETKVGELAPKAAALDIISTADGSVCISTAAKLWQVRPKDAFLWLSCNRYIFKRHGSGVWIGYQDKIQQGLLEMKTDTVERSDGTKKTVESVLVTPKGLAKLAALIGGKEAA
jgi:anti-repressor protein